MGNLEIKKIASFILNKRKFIIPEPELKGVDTRYFNNFMIMAGINQFKVEFNQLLFEEIHNGLLKLLKKDIPTTLEDLNDYLENYIDYLDISKGDYIRVEELNVLGILHLIKNCRKEDIRVLDIYEKLNPLLKFGLLKTCFEGFIATEDIIKFIEKFQFEYPNVSLHQYLFENVEVEKYFFNGKLLEVIEFLVKVNQPNHDIILNILLWEIIKFEPIKGLEIVKNLEREERYNALIINSLRSLNSTVQNFDYALDIILEKESKIFAEKIITLGTFSRKVVDDKFQLRIKNEIIRILKISEENGLHAILQYLDWFQFEELEKLELLKKIVENPNFSERLFIRNQSNYHFLDYAIYRALKSPYSILDFFKFFVSNSMHEFVPGNFEFTIREILVPKIHDIIPFIGQLLIDSKGIIRKLGFKLIEYLIEENVEFDLKDFIENLEEDDDLKLILTLNVPFSNRPFELFKIATPIMEKNELQSLQQMIGFAIDKFTNYQEIISYFEMFLKNENDLSLVKTLLENNQNYRESILKKNQQYKYFNSELIFYQYFNLYGKYWHDNMNKIYSKIQNEGLIKFFSKKKLLKGGGYKFSGKTRINKLSHIQSSVTFPNEAFLNYDQRTFDTIIFFSEDWSNNNIWEKWMKKF